MNVGCAWQQAWRDYARHVGDFTREQLAEQGRRVAAAMMRPEDHHRAREQAIEGPMRYQVRWPSYTYLPRNILNSWLIGQYGWTTSRAVSDLMMPVAQIGASLIGFDAAPVGRPLRP